jgi:hypothetical protein
MFENRFSSEMIEGAPIQVPPGFYLLPVPAVAAAPVSPMQWLYQHLYERAQQASQQSNVRDLFSVMN